LVCVCVGGGWYRAAAEWCFVSGISSVPVLAAYLYLAPQLKLKSVCSADRERCGCIPYRTETPVIWGMKRGENVPCHYLCAASHKPVPTMRIHFGNISNDRLLSLLKCSQGRFLNFIAFEMTGRQSSNSIRPKASRSSSSSCLH